MKTWLNGNIFRGHYDDIEKYIFLLVYFMWLSHPLNFLNPIVFLKCPHLCFFLLFFFFVFVDNYGKFWENTVENILNSIKLDEILSNSTQFITIFSSSKYTVLSNFSTIIVAVEVITFYLDLISIHACKELRIFQFCMILCNYIWVYKIPTPTALNIAKYISWIIAALLSSENSSTL